MKRKYLLSLILLISASSFAQKENLGKRINTKFNETSPKLTADGKSLFFIRENDPKNTFGANDTQDAWFVSLEKDSVVAEAKHLEAPFNQNELNAVLYQSADGQVRIMTGDYDEKGKLISNGYSEVHKEKNGWGTPKKVEIKKYKKYDKGYYNGFTMAPSGNVIILALSENKEDEYTSLYVSHKQRKGKWSEPEILEGLTTGKDYGVFISPDNKTMYFSSFRKGGLGGSDVYVTKREDDSWTKWSAPINLGSEVNTSGDDAHYQVSPTGNFAFVVSDENGNKDVYRIPLAEVAEEKKPDPVIIVEGFVKDAKTNSPLSALIEYANLETNKVEGEAHSDPTTGAYKLVLPYGKNYGLSATQKGYYSESIAIDLQGKGEFDVVKEDISLTAIEKETVVVLNNLFFETGKSELLPTSIDELNRLVKLLKGNKGMTIEIGGHTDHIGNNEFNKKLSKLRAESVVKYLVENGVKKSRLTAKGYGESMPLESNKYEEGRAKNRRVEFKVLTIK